MKIEEHRQDGIAVVAPVGRIDSTTSGVLERHLSDLVGGGERRIVVDFASVDYISSAGLRVMLTLAKKTRELRGALALCGMGNTVREVFGLAGFLPLFTIEGSREAAVARVTAR
jgi:anti-anti-sigma factor